MQKRVECSVFGEVQGVSYRHFTKETAKRLGLIGFVKNLSDGTVEVVAEGEERALRQFTKALKEGYPLAKVSQVREVWGEATGDFKTFLILTSSIMTPLEF